MPAVALVAFRANLTCLSHLHWEVGPFIMPISRIGVRIVPPSRRAACSVPQGCQRSPLLQPHPGCSPPVARRMRETAPANSALGRPTAGAQRGRHKGASCSSGDPRAPRERDEQGNNSGVSPQGHRSDSQARPAETGPRAPRQSSEDASVRLPTVAAAQLVP